MELETIKLSASPANDNDRAPSTIGGIKSLLCDGCGRDRRLEFGIRVGDGARDTRVAHVVESAREERRAGLRCAHREAGEGVVAGHAAPPNSGI